MLTPSPSMDILVSSNLERQLFELTGRNAEAIRGWMAQQKAEKRFQVDAETFRKLRADFASDSVDSAECLKTIRAVYEEHGYLLDPHSAVAFKVAERLRGDNPVLVASTAHWAKFGENVYRALHGMVPGEPLPADVAALTGCQLNARIAEATGCGPVPAGLAELDDKPIRFTQVIDGDAGAIEQAVLDFLAE
jgi:threonine synthase